MAFHNIELSPKKKEGKMAFCFCRFILAVLVVVFALIWAPWTKIFLIIIGILLALLALNRNWCCMAKKPKAPAAPTTPQG
jgi:hypothetical protein